jgi:hypothetical protein
MIKLTPPIPAQRRCRGVNRIKLAGAPVFGVLPLVTPG